MLLTIEELKLKFPTPSVSPKHPIHTKEHYCVGGAIARNIDERMYGFPHHSSLAMSLKYYKEDIPYEARKSYAEKIITLNDSRDFDAAWSAFGSFLSL